MQSGGNAALRTRVYIDGYNLYYGCLKKSSYKWLDVRALLQHVLMNVPYQRDGVPITYRFETPAIKYFTAPILKAFAKSDDSVSSQANYHQDRPVHKPLSWYPRPDLLGPIFEEAKRVRGSTGAARRWLNQPCSHLGDRVPITMCEQEDSAAELRDYMEVYANRFGI